jgi:hypothetical protein
MGNEDRPASPFLKETLTVNPIRSEIGWQMSAKEPCNSEASLRAVEEGGLRVET